MNDKLNKILLGDCFDILPELPDQSIDMILTDPPYGSTDCKWDKVIDLQRLWIDLNRIIKQHGAIIVTSQQPFTTDVIAANRKFFRYEIIWEKTMAVGQGNANRMPLRAHENILIFYKRLPVFNPQKTQGEPYHKLRTASGGVYANGGLKLRYITASDGMRFPRSVIKISNWNGALFGDTSRAVKHPTQKPIDLFAWLVKTYTNEGDIVLDPFSGSGTTAITCSRLNRQFICIEKEREFYEYSLERLNGDTYQPELDMSIN